MNEKGLEKGLATKATVMVTGATGYVAGWVVKRLLEAGCTVHATVRDTSKRSKLKYLDELAVGHAGRLRYFQADLLDIGSFAEAMQGCELIFHTASPFVINVADPQRDLVDPAVVGTRNVLEQANKTESVRRVVVTSSCAAIYGDNADLQNCDGEMFTEEDWNTTSSLEHQAYSYSKVLAEKAAWEMADVQSQWSLVTINPSLVLGPGINPFGTSESFTLLRQLGDGTMRMGVPDYGLGVVDVRDVADAHMRAGFMPSAKGRYITSGHNTNFPTLARILREKYGKTYRLPMTTLPKPLVWLVGPLAEKSLTRKIVSRNIGWPFLADNSKSKRQLGMQYQPLEDSVIDMFQQMIEHGVINTN